MAKRKKPKRSNNAGSVHQRKDGRWVGALLVGYDDDGRPKRRYYYGKTKEEAEGKLLEAMHAHRSGILLDPATETVKQYLERWLRDSVKNSVRPQTYASYSSNVKNHIVPSLGQVLLRQLTPAHVQALYTKKLEEGLSPRSVQYVHAILHRALEQAVKWGLVPRNVTEAADKPKVQRKAMQVLTAEQARRFLQVAQEDRLYALYVLAVTTGMRQGEIVGLTWEHVNLEAGRIHVVQQLQRLPKQSPILVPPKTGKSRRVIVLSSIAVAALKKHRAQQAQERLFLGEGWQNSWNLVFTDEFGRPIDRDRVSRSSFKRLLRKADLPDIRFHDLRHTAATLLLEAGEHPKVVQEMLGHSSITLTLDTYSHVLPSMQKEAAARMQNILTAATTKQ